MCAASRLISFRIEQFGTVAMIQDAHVNMPFQSWELRPRGAANHAQLTVTAAVVEVEIQIKVRAANAGTWPDCNGVSGGTCPRPALGRPKNV